jgi:two-component system copper resistance phosphate regulon response regulator CusR
MRILLVEDESKVARFIARGLTADCFAVDTAADGNSGLDLAAEYHYDLIILDLMLPGKSGTEILRQLRRKDTNVPVLVLSARDGVADKVGHLELGADDYLTKPFSVRELLARVAAILRRAKGADADIAAYDDGQLRIEPRTLRVYVGGDEVKLAKKELELLRMLIRNRPSVVSRDRILSEVWQMADDVETRTVDAHIRNLRKKIGKERIQTVIGYGYRFE